MSRQHPQALQCGCPPIRPFVYGERGETPPCHQPASVPRADPEHFHDAPAARPARRRDPVPVSLLSSQHADESDGKPSSPARQAQRFRVHRRARGSLTRPIRGATLDLLVLCDPPVVAAPEEDRARAPRSEKTAWMWSGTGSCRRSDRPSPGGRRTASCPAGSGSGIRLGSTCRRTARPPGSRSRCHGRTGMDPPAAVLDRARRELSRDPPPCSNGGG